MTRGERARSAVACVHVAVLACVMSAAVAGQRPQQSPGLPEIAAGNTAANVSRTEWDWTIFVLGDAQALGQIKCVTYLLHPTFPDRIRQVCDRGNLPGKGFLFGARGWGTFTVGITVDFRDGRQQLLTHNLDFTTRAEGWGVVKSPHTDTTIIVPVTAPRLKDGHFNFSLRFAPGAGGTSELTSIDIDVREDGSTLGSRWNFEILMNDRTWRLPTKIYNDHQSPVRLTGATLARLGGSRGMRVSGAAAIRIRGS